MRRGALGVLRHRDFRLLWCGLVVSAIGTWMQIVAQALLVLDLSHGSAAALGLVSLVQAAAFFLFALFGGAVADRIDKRRLLILTQSLSMIFALIMAILAAAHLIAIWMVLVLVFLQGASLSFDQPARAALVPLLVPQEEIFNAVSLQSVVFTGASTVGPALAGLALSRIGYAGNFFANAVSYLGVIGALWIMRVPPSPGAVLRTTNWRAIAEALAAVRADTALSSIIVVFAALLFLGPSSAVLIPVMGRSVLHLDAPGVGILFAATGFGSVLGGVTLASLRNPAHKGRIVLLCALLWAAALAAFGVSRSFAPAALALVLLGSFQIGVSATTITLLQTRVPVPMRGRVMSLNTLLNMGVRPLGDFPAAAIIGAVGAPLTALGAAALVALVALATATRAAARDA
jgi:MFS family permease